MNSKKTEKKEEGKPLDVLDQIKNVEKNIKAALLIKAINRLKEMIRRINEIKAECRFTLEDIGINDKDIKRIIDFVGDTSDVKLSDEDKKILRVKVKEFNNENKKKIEEKLDDISYVFEPANDGTTGGFFSKYNKNTYGGSIACETSTNKHDNSETVFLSNLDNDSELKFTL